MHARNKCLLPEIKHLARGCASAAATIDALLLDKGFTGSRFAAEMASGGI